MSDHNWEYRDWANERKCRSCGLLVRGYGSPAMPCTGPKAPGPKPAGDTGRHGLDVAAVAEVFGGPIVYGHEWDPTPGLLFSRRLCMKCRLNGADIRSATICDGPKAKRPYARASWDIDPTETPAIRRAMLGARHG